MITALAVQVWQMKLTDRTDVFNMDGYGPVLYQEEYLIAELNQTIRLNMPVETK